MFRSFPLLFFKSLLSQAPDKGENGFLNIDFIMQTDLIINRVALTAIIGSTFCLLFLRQIIKSPMTSRSVCYTVDFLISEILVTTEHVEQSSDHRCVLLRTSTPLFHFIFVILSS